MTPEQAFCRYEAVRDRLPKPATSAAQAERIRDLTQIADTVDAFVFDAYGVLNVGETPIDGACERIAELRARGKDLFVLTNAASYCRADTLLKFRKLGFDFTETEIVSSREVCETFLSRHPEVKLWGVAATEAWTPAEMHVPAVRLADDPATYRQIDGVLLLSSADWSQRRHDLLRDSLAAHPRPVIVANPDLVAPRESGLSLEPGYFAHDLQDRLGIEVEYHGKPFPSVYSEIETRLGYGGARIAMVGDTLHTDVLGAQAQGWRTVLISDHGLFAGLDVDRFISTSGLKPDWIAPSI
jgi:HAD superfamily hydrolase (TIGR01450 family)